MRQRHELGTDRARVRDVLGSAAPTLTLISWEDVGRGDERGALLGRRAEPVRESFRAEWVVLT